MITRYDVDVNIRIEEVDLTQDELFVIRSNMEMNICSDHIGFKNPDFGRDLRNDWRFSRIILKVGPEEKGVLAHPVVLSQSRFFDNLFNDGNPDFPDVSIEFPELESEIVETLVEYLYTGLIEISRNKILETLLAAHKFELEEIRSHCSKVIADSINSENFWMIREFARKHGFEDLMECTNVFMVRDLPEIIVSERFLEFSFPDVVALISGSSGNRKSSVIILEAVLKWVEHKEADRQTHLLELLENVDIADIFSNSTEFLKTLIAPGNLLGRHPQCLALCLNKIIQGEISRNSRKPNNSTSNDSESDNEQSDNVEAQANSPVSNNSDSEIRSDTRPGPSQQRPTPELIQEANQSISRQTRQNSSKRVIDFGEDSNGSDSGPIPSTTSEYSNSISPRKKSKAADSGESSQINSNGDLESPINSNTLENLSPKRGRGRPSFRTPKKQIRNPGPKMPRKPKKSPQNRKNIVHPRGLELEPLPRNTIKNKMLVFPVCHNTKYYLEGYIFQKQEIHRLHEITSPRRMSSLAYHNGTIFDIGGSEDMLSNFLEGRDACESSKMVKVYTRGVGKPTDGANLKTERKELGACVCNDVIYAVGGCVGDETMNRVEILPLHQRSSKSEWIEPDVGMEYTRGTHGVTTFAGKIYAVGGIGVKIEPGRDKADSIGEDLNSAEMYNPAQPDSDWELLPDMKSRRGFVMVAVLGGKLYAIGGSIEVPQCTIRLKLRTVEMYDLVAHPPPISWTQCVSMNKCRSRGAVVVDEEKEMIYVIGGDLKSAPTMEVYDVKLNQWMMQEWPVNLDPIDFTNTIVVEPPY